MKRLLLLTPFLAAWMTSCTHEDETPIDKQIQFAFTEPENENGKTATTVDAQSVIVTIKDPDGAVVVDREELTLHKFGDNFLSLPLTLKASGASSYRLSEFFVVGSDNHVTYVTPKEGSTFAHLVSDPLDIEFAVEKDKISTVTPEVIAVEDDTDAGDYGYGQFGFEVVKTIRALFTSVIKSADNFELTSAHLKIEGLESNPDGLILWTYETELEAKVDTLTLKEAPLYRITATKAGYPDWVQTTTILNLEKIDILFEKISTVDVYVVGTEKNGQNVSTPKYWKNGEAVYFSDSREGYASGIYVVNDDVYVSGNEVNGTITKTIAKYWKNGAPVYLTSATSNASAQSIIVSGNDVHVVGVIDAKPAYWKNGNLVPLTNGTYTNGYAYGITLDGNDVYIAGVVYNGTKGIATYWKNGNAVSLTANDPNTDARANAITIYNGDVYVGGFIWNKEQSNTYVSAYWKNGVVFPVERSEEFGSESYSIAVSGSDVYLAGWEGEQTDNGYTRLGKYWKNGKSIPVNDNSYTTIVYSIAVLDGQVYASGSAAKRKPAETDKAYSWINGEPLKLGTKFSDARTIFPVKK